MADACTNVLLDAFTGADGTDLPVHTFDLVAAGFVWHSSGLALLEIQSNRAVSVDPSGGLAQAYNVAESAHPGLVLPYKVTLSAFCDGDDTGGGTYFHLDGVDSESQIRIDLYPTSAHVFVGNNFSTTYDSAEATYAVAGGVPHVVELLVESGQMTATIDGVAHTAVAMSGGASPTDAAYITVGTNAGASYVDSISVCNVSAVVVSLPSITEPPGTPVFDADGHSNEDDTVFSHVKMGTGHSRARRIHTVPERVVDVSKWLTAAQLVAYDTWYEETLQCGALEFAARVAARGPGLEWYRARWISYETEMSTKQRGRVSGQLLLKGVGTTTPPDRSALASEVAIALNAIAGTAISVPKALRTEIVIALGASTSVLVQPGVGALSSSSYVPRTVIGTVRSLSVGSVAFTGRAPAVLVGVIRSPGLGAISTQSLAPTVS